jgi:drug/metabolite transporter (DMT)-like permease
VPAARTTGITLVVVSAASFGGLGVLARIAYDDGAHPFGVLLVRFSVAAACFIALRALRPAPRPTGRTLAGLVGMGICYLAQAVCYFSAVDHAPPGLVALLLYTYPAVVVVLGAVFMGVRMSAPAVVATAAAMAGTALVVGPSAGAGDPVGIAFGLGAAGIYAFYILLGSRVLARVDALWASTVIMTTAAVGFAVLYLVSPERPALPASGKGWLAVIAIAILCTVIAGMAFLAGLARVGPADASTLSTIEPVVSVALSAIVIGEPITAWTVAGGALVLGAVLVLSRTRPAPAPNAVPGP